MKNKKIIFILIAIILVIAIAVSAVLIIKSQNDDESKETETVETPTVETETPELEEKNDEEESKMKKNPVVTMKIKDYGTVKIELYPDIAPNTVKNFISLVKEGYYDGLIFHRIIDGFMAQGGDKEGTGSGETEFTIPGEFEINGFKNTLKHEKGVISMARADYTQIGKPTEGYNSAFSQFFIMFEDTSSLDGMYAAFGKVIEGMDVIDALADVEIKAGTDRPVNPPVIESMTVDTFEIDYGEPERLERFDVKAYIEELRRNALQ